MRSARLWAAVAVVASGLGWAAACRDDGGTAGPPASKRDARSDVLRGIVASKQPMPEPEKLEAQRQHLHGDATPTPAPPASADTATPEEDNRPEPLAGTVEQVDSGTLLVRDARGEAQAVQLDGNTRFVRGGKVVDRRAVREGSEVRVFYDAQRGPQVAHEVELLGATKPKK